MSFIEIFLLAVALSMDAFAISICAGLSMAKVTFRNSLVAGLYFGLAQAIMPLIGFLIATLFAESIIDYGYWIAFGLLCFIGGKMIIGSFKDEKSEEMSLKPAKMLPLAIATSIDALAVGVSLVFLRVPIVPASSIIGIVTLVISMVGVKIGGMFGAKFKSKAELVGGIMLVLIGLKILLENTL